MNKINLPETVSLKCMFCGSSDFRVEEGNNENIKEQDTYECSSCGELNTYEGLMAISTEDVVNAIKDDIENYAKDLFKKFK